MKLKTCRIISKAVSQTIIFWNTNRFRLRVYIKVSFYSTGMLSVLNQQILPHPMKIPVGVFPSSVFPNSFSLERLQAFPTDNTDKSLWNLRHVTLFALTDIDRIIQNVSDRDYIAEELSN